MCDRATHPMAAKCGAVCARYGPRWPVTVQQKARRTQFQPRGLGSYERAILYGVNLDVCTSGIQDAKKREKRDGGGGIREPKGS